MTMVVAARVNNANGSKISKDRLPSRAITRISTRRAYFTMRQRGEIVLARLRAARKETHSKSVPVGQIQPHQKRPKRIVSPRITNVHAKPGNQLRLASIAV